MDKRRSDAPPASKGSSYYVIRALIMGVVTIVLTGYVLLWIMMPTNIYWSRWKPELRSQTTSTFFGPYQGATYLTMTFPILFVAVLGCVYLYLAKKARNDGSSGEHKLATWRKPLIIKGLGIVSGIELSFFLLFMALLVWNLGAYFVAGFERITPTYAASYGMKVWEAKLESAAVILGLVGNFPLTLLFFPVTRGSSVLALFGLTSEASVKYHIWLGHIMMAFFTAHGLTYIIFWAVTHDLSEMLKWDKTGISNVAGEISLLAGLFLWATTFPRVRRKMFELFFYTHHLYILFILFFVLHLGISYSCIMLPGFFLFMIDRYLRFLQSHRGVRVVSARVLPCETVELNFSKSRGLSYSPTSVMFVNVPAISSLQWHPFTVSSSSSLESDTISVIIKGDGKWSNTLYQMLASDSSADRLAASIEGPYGPVSTNFPRHDLLVMISGGSGIAPFISIIRELIYTSETLKCKTPEILLISSFKNSADLAMLDLILPISGSPSKFQNLGIQIEAFVTREKQPPSAQVKKNIRTIFFKPNSSDVPITPILGRNSWLWLGAIISSSFIIYLIFIGILTRYYIYPIDHNEDDVYPSSARAVLHILFMCIGIIITSTAAFLWNKNKYATEPTQIQNIEGVNPVATQNSCHYNEERELESFPQQSLSQAITVHYGQRPDFKRFLFDRKESSIGVLASGPKSLRKGVAKMCSSGSAANLHFEYISFTW